LHVTLNSVDAIFKTLTDPNRRILLDELHRENGRTLSNLCGRLDMSRQAVTKHLNLLEEANLVAVVWRGREKLHYLNPVPLHEIYEHLIFQISAVAPTALSDLKTSLEHPKQSQK